MITEELELAAHDELPINDPLDGYVREDHLLARLNVHQRTLRRAGPPRIRVGRHVWYRRSAVHDWLLSRENAC